MVIIESFWQVINHGDLGRRSCFLRSFSPQAMRSRAAQNVWQWESPRLLSPSSPTSCFVFAPFIVSTRLSSWEQSFVAGGLRVLSLPLSGLFFPPWFCSIPSLRRGCFDQCVAVVLLWRTLVVVEGPNAGDWCEERTRRRQAEQASAVPATERERASEQAAQAEQERKARIDEARNEVIQFYDEHEALLADLPRALFRSQLQNQFPATIAPEQAWQAAMPL